MFTGLIRYQGRLRARAGNALRVDCPRLRPRLAPGASVQEINRFMQQFKEMQKLTSGMLGLAKRKKK